MTQLNSAYLEEISRIILPAVWETVFMVFFSSLFSILFGAVIGTVLFVTEKGNILENQVLNGIMGFIVNIARSIPFLILIIAILPLSRLIVGTSIGSTAAIVPLTIAATPFVARVMESSLKELDYGVIEASISVGASPWQIITRVMIREAASSIVLGITLTVINLTGYSAMAGVIGGGGLGDVAIRYGYQRYRVDILIITIVIMVILVQVIQAAGNYIAARLDKRK